MEYKGKSYTVCGAINYDFWSNPVIRKVNTDTSNSLTITLTSSSYSCSDGASGSWRDYKGTAQTRRWVGVVLQAGGGAGGASWINHVGGGGSGGGFWIGLVNISSGTTRITIEKYSSGGGDGQAGAAVSLSNNNCSITVNPGRYTTGSSNGGTTEGGDVTISGSGFITYKSVTGGKGGYVSSSGGNRISVSNVPAPTPDTDYIPISAANNLTSMYTEVWWGSGEGGQGGFSPLGMGGIPAASGSQVSDAGQNGFFSSYGAGGGGSTSGNWGKKNGGSGGYPFVCIGF